MASPYQICISQSEITLLNKKLELTRLPDEIDEAGWDYGAPLADIKRLIGRWKDGYDWKKHESALNTELPQFIRAIEVEGHGFLNIHYIYKKSLVEGAIPLLFVHGWPGSFIEVRKILPLLTSAEEDQPSFDVVAMGMPGYGFSEGSTIKGFNLTKHGEVGHKLMLSLGYEHYVTQGGDWGALITQEMATTYGHAHIKAWHSNMPYTEPPPSVGPSKYTPEESSAIERIQWWSTKGSGYFAVQTTQPQTIGYSLTDSPVGLLAWIYEKLINWSDGYQWEDDEVLTWVSIYWFSRSGPAASVRTYYEYQRTLDHIRSQSQAPALPSIPFGVSFFPKEILAAPVSWLSDRNLVFQNYHKKGGHFAAHEVPELLVEDLRKMFGKGGPAYGVVDDRDGYRRALT